MPQKKASTAPKNEELTCDELAAFTPGSEWISVTKLPHA